jgi:surfactin synthase thioesterase subunit
VSREDLEQWQPHTTDMRTVALFEGGHFYFREQPANVTAMIADIAKERLGLRP